MAEEKRVARTASISGNFVVGDLTITPEGVELTKEQWISVRDAGFANGVRVALDDEFSPEVQEAPEPESTDAEAPGKQSPEKSDIETSTPASGRGRGGRG